MPQKDLHFKIYRRAFLLKKKSKLCGYSNLGVASTAALSLDYLINDKYAQAWPIADFLKGDQC